MNLYSIEDSFGMRKYYVAQDTNNFKKMIVSDIAKDKKINRTQAKKLLKDYSLKKYNEDVEVPLIDEEILCHYQVFVKQLLQTNQGYIGYALMNQYYFE